MFWTYFWVMVAGALGTGARFGLSNLIALRFPVFPMGTLIVNISGCFIIGLVAGLTGPNGPFLASPLTRQIIMIGFLGGYTTFSSFSLQTINLLTDGQWLYAGLNVLLSVALCLLGAWGGLALAGLCGNLTR